MPRRFAFWVPSSPSSHECTLEHFDSLISCSFFKYTANRQVHLFDNGRQIYYTSTYTLHCTGVDQAPVNILLLGWDVFWSVPKIELWDEWLHSYKRAILAFHRHRTNRPIRVLDLVPPRVTESQFNHMYHICILFLFLFSRSSPWPRAN